MRIVALDPGTAMGWAVYNSTTNVTKSGVWYLKHGDDEFEDQRLVRVQQQLDRFKRPVDLLVYERNRDQRHPQAIRIHGQIEGAILLWANDQSVPFGGVNPASVLKWILGPNYVKQLRSWKIWAKTHKEKTPGFKDLKRHAAYEKFAFTCDTHDELDAYILLQYARDVVAPAMGLKGE